MATTDHSQGRSPGHSDDNGASNAQLPDRLRLEETLVKSRIWKKQTLRDIELTRALSASESSDRDTQTERMVFRLSAQLDSSSQPFELRDRTAATSYLEARRRKGPAGLRASARTRTAPGRTEAVAGCLRSVREGVRQSAFGAQSAERASPRRMPPPKRPVVAGVIDQFSRYIVPTTLGP